MNTNLHNHRHGAIVLGLPFVAALILLLSSFTNEETLAAAIVQGDLERVQAMIKADPTAIAAHDSYGETPLHVAAGEGQVEIAKWLVEQGADIEAADIKGYRPLHHSCDQIESRLALFKLLLEAGAEINSLSRAQGSPLMRLTHTRDCDYESAVYLIDHGADLNVSNGAVLVNCTTSGYNDLVEVLLAAGAVLPSNRSEQFRLQHRAALGGVPLVFMELLAEGCSPEPSGSSGAMMLEAAAIGGSPEIGEALLELGVPPDSLNRFSVAPIHKAAEGGRTAFVELLIENGASMNVRNGLGQTAYNIAEENNYPALQTLIRERGGSTAAQLFPELKGDYFGQLPPDKQPKHFAPGIVSLPGRKANLTSAPVFSPDGSEMLCTYEFYGSILHSSRVDGVWSPPQPVPFLSDEGDSHPVFSADGKKVFFLSKRLPPNGGAAGVHNIWYVQRTSRGWGRPRLVSGELPAYRASFQFCLDSEDSIYLAAEIEGGAGGRDIYRVPFVDGEYGKLESLGPAVNSEFNDQMPSISSDGKTMVFTRFGHQDGAGSYDILVSRLNSDGEWGDAVWAGSPVNTRGGETCPVLSQNGKYLFWLRGSAAYWVSTSVLS